MRSKYNQLIFRCSILLLSLSLSYFILKSEHFKNLLEVVLPVQFLGEFFAGMLYTSFLTTPVSIAILALIAEEGNPVIAALIAGAGATFGDLLIVKFFRDKLNRDFSMITNHPLIKKADRLLIKYKLEMVKPILGLLVIASPFPDELGLLLLGATDLKINQLIPLTYIMNTIGILLIMLPISLL